MQRRRRRGPIKFWLGAHPRIDLFLALLCGAIALIAFQFHSSPGRKLTVGVLNDGSWATYMQTLSGVSAALLGFGATAIALVLAIGAGRRGQAVLTMAGGDLNNLLAHCLGSLCAVTLALAIAGNLQPSDSRPAFATGLTLLVTLMVLRIARLWYFLHRLVGVYIRDVSQLEKRSQGGGRN